jgi:L-amino acid N-acyltransferase YncA
MSSLFLSCFGWIGGLVDSFSAVQGSEQRLGSDVRPAMAADAEAICAIYNAALAERGSTFETEPRSAGDFTDRIVDSRFPLRVATAPRVIGWAGLAPYSARPCYAGIAECSVYVAPEARGRGVGTSLTETLAGVAVQAGFHKLLGKVFTDNTASVRLVERCGFRRVGLHRRHGQLDGEWRDVLVVERLLQAS